jgi:hypothetical protein
VTEVFLKRTLTGLAADDDHAVEILKRWPLGERVKADIRKPRAHRSLRRWWVLCTLVSQNSEQFKSPEMAHAYLKIRTGHAVPIVNKATGETFLIPDSISYDAIDELEFENIWTRAVQVIAEEILGTGREEIEMEIQRLVGFAR